MTFQATSRRMLTGLLLGGLAFLMGQPATAHEGHDAASQTAPSASTQPSAPEHDHDSWKKDGRRGGWSSNPLSPDELEQAIAVIRQIRPDLAQRLEQMQQEDPESVQAAIKREFPRLRHFLELQRVDPELFELRVQDVKLAYRSHQLATDLRAAQDQAQADPQQAQSLRQQLETAVREHFEIRQRIREHELTRLERQIELLRAQLQARSQTRDELIAQRIGELTGQKTDLDW